MLVDVQQRENAALRGIALVFFWLGLLLIVVWAMVMLATIDRIS